MISKRTLPNAGHYRLARGAPGKRCYAIGDVHGRLDLLTSLLDHIQADHRARTPRDGFIVFLGDLIDRGPDSRGVIERVMAPVDGFRTLSIMGNHEEMLVRGLTGEADVLPGWLAAGGFECAQSYGVPIGGLLGAPGAEIEPVLSAHIPPAHVTFLSGFIESVRFGDYLLVHAGVRPGVPLERQGREMRWIRSGFLDEEVDLGFVVVHGHTVTEDVEARAHRIGIDTGAYRTGALTCLMLDGEDREIIQAFA